MVNNKNVVKGKESEAMVMAFIQKNGPSQAREIGVHCGRAKRGAEKSWAWSVCRRLVAQGSLVRRKIGQNIWYDLPVRDGGKQ